MIRIILIAITFLMPIALTPALAGDANVATLYKTPQCGCCEGYADYLRRNGYTVTVIPTHDLGLIKNRNNVPKNLEGCHTTLIDGYVVEGHVPLGTMNKLLSERPALRGISLPGMPLGSPGMSGDKQTPFTIYELSEGAPVVYAVE